MIQPAVSIDEVIDVLQQIIDTELSKNSMLACFPALYRQVTVKVKEAIHKNEFEDGPRMQQLDVCFANRYITAYLDFKSGKPLPASWRIAFEAAGKPMLILQHLLLGMNAHINFDLGIAAAETMHLKPLPDLKNDFDHINQILSDMTAITELRIGKVSPLIGLLDRLAGNTDTMLVKFSITEARDGAWKSAAGFHGSGNLNALLTSRDKKVSALGLRLIYPESRLVRNLLGTIRLMESGNVRKIVSTLTE